MKIGVYVHVPFCLKRCTYCDFNTYTGLLSLKDDYIAALQMEMRQRIERGINLEARTLYFGGGTPSLLDLDSIARVVDLAHRHLHLPWDAEVTLEANPGTVHTDYLKGLLEVGVNRLSLGVQSSHSRDLVLLGRIHTWQQAVRSYCLAREAGFANINLDLMYGLPGQTVIDWLETLTRCLDLEPEHLSLYALTLEPGTALSETLAIHDAPQPDPDLAADMYEAASGVLHGAGFWQYEISNWALGDRPAPDIWTLPPTGQVEVIGPYVSAHNLIYWRNQSWLGFGAGAHSWFRGRRFSNYPHPRVYINAVQGRQPRRFSNDVVDQQTVYGETMMMGLRLVEGVTDARFFQRFGIHLNDLYAPVIERFCDLGLVSWQGGRVRLTQRGRLLGNQVFEAFLLDGVGTHVKVT